MSRLRLAAGVALAALAGYWAAVALREPAGSAPAAVSPLSVALRPGERCPDCPHLGHLHDPDLGCTGKLYWRAAESFYYDDRPCPCRRPGCACPDIATDPPDRRR